MKSQQAKIRGIQRLLKERYTRQSLKAVAGFLRRHRTHEIKSVAHGLFAATGELESSSVTGYQNAWVRDNIMIASSFYSRGQANVARATMEGLTSYFHKHLHRFRNVIKNPLPAPPALLQGHRILERCRQRRMGGDAES